VRPIARKFDQADEYPFDLAEQMKALGLFGATIGQERGGLGLAHLPRFATGERRGGDGYNSLDAMRILGGCNYPVDFDVERYHRDSPLMCIGEGTHAMQRISIARPLVGRSPV